MTNEARIRRLRAELDSLRDPVLGFIRAGRPRFDRLFGRDSLIVAWQRLEREPGIAVATLRILASMQGRKEDRETEEEPGKILHEWDPSPMPEIRWLRLPYYGTVDATPLFVLVAAWTVERLHDEALRLELWPSVRAACEWLMRVMERTTSRLLAYDPSPSAPTLRHQGWKDTDDLGPRNPTAVVEAQGYAYSALLHAAVWAERLEPSLAPRWRSAADLLKKNVNVLFWMKTQRTCALAVQGDGTQYAAVTSNPGHLLFTGILDASHELLLIGRLFESDLFTPYGIRTLSSKEPDFRPDSYHKGSIWPHDNWIIAEGLRAVGHVRERDTLLNALFDAHDALGKMPELYAVRDGAVEEIPIAQYPQAWATGALLNALDSSRDAGTALRILPPSDRG